MSQSTWRASTVRYVIMKKLSKILWNDRELCGMEKMCVAASHNFCVDPVKYIKKLLLIESKMVTSTQLVKSVAWNLNNTRHLLHVLKIARKIDGKNVASFPISFTRVLHNLNQIQDQANVHM